MLVLYTKKTMQCYNSLCYAVYSSHCVTLLISSFR